MIRPSGLKITASIIAMIFALTDVCQAAPAVQFQGQQGTPAAWQPLDLLRTLPEEFGRPAHQHTVSPQAKDSPVVFHIQDAHSNPQAQRSIFQTIRYIAEQAEAKNAEVFVAVEGASGRLHPEYFDFFPDYGEAGDAVVQDLLGKGELSGAELFAWELYKRRKKTGGAAASISIFGAESSELYAENLKSYQAMLRIRSEVQEVLSRLYLNMEKAASRLLDVELLEFLKERSRRKEGRYHSGPSQGSSDLTAYIRYLQGSALKYLKIDIAEALEQLRFPNFIRVDRIAQARSALDAEAAAGEWRRILEMLRKSPRQEAARPLLEELTALAIQHGYVDEPNAQERMKSSAAQGPVRTLLEKIYLFGRDEGMEWSGKQQFFYSMRLIILENELDGPGLFQEMDKLESWIIESLAVSPEAKAFTEKLQKAELLQKLVCLELTRVEHERVMALGRELHALSKEFLGPEDAARIDENIREAVKFYQNARLRDTALVSNALGSIKKSALERRDSSLIGPERQSVLILITGGFHSAGIGELLEKKGLNYAVIQPHIHEIDGGGRYDRAMSGANADLSIYFKQENPFSTKQEALLFRAFLEVALPAAGASETLSFPAFAAMIERGIFSHPVLSAAVTARSVVQDDFPAVHFFSKRPVEMPSTNRAAISAALASASASFHRLLDAKRPVPAPASYVWRPSSDRIHRPSKEAPLRAELRSAGEPLRGGITDQEYVLKRAHYLANLIQQQESRDGLNEVAAIPEPLKDVFLAATEIIGLLTRDPANAWSVREFLKDAANEGVVQKLVSYVEKISKYEPAEIDFDEELRAGGQESFLAVFEALLETNAYSPLRLPQNLPVALHLDTVKLERYFASPENGYLPRPQDGEPEITDLWFVYDPKTVLGLVASHREKDLPPHAKGGIRYIHPLDKDSHYDDNRLYMALFKDPTLKNLTQQGVVVDLFDLVRSQETKNILGTKFHGAKGEYTFMPGAEDEEAFKKYAGAFIDAGILAHEVPGPDIGMSGTKVQNGIDEARRIFKEHLARELKYFSMLTSADDFSAEQLHPFSISVTELEEARRKFRASFDAVKDPMLVYEEALKIIEDHTNIRFTRNRIIRLARTYVVRDYLRSQVKTAWDTNGKVFETTEELTAFFYAEVMEKANAAGFAAQDFRADYSIAGSPVLQDQINKILGAVITGGLDSQGAIDHVVSAITAKGVDVAYRRVKDYLIKQGVLEEGKKVNLGYNGAGDVGGSAALMAARRGDRVRLIQDVYGTVYRQKGFSVAQLQEFNNIPPSKRNAVEFFSRLPDTMVLDRERLFSGDPEIQLDVLVTAAVANTINERNVENVIRSFKAVVEGGNNTYKNVARQLAEAGIVTAWGSTANIGGVMASTHEDKAKHQYTVDELTRPNIRNVYEDGHEGPVLQAAMRGHLERLPLLKMSNTSNRKRRAFIELTDGRVTKTANVFPDLPLNTYVDVIEVATPQGFVRKAYVNNIEVGEVGLKGYEQRLRFQMNGNDTTFLIVEDGEVRTPNPALASIKIGKVKVRFPVRERKYDTYRAVGKTIFAYQTVILALTEPGNPERDAIHIQRALSQMLVDKKREIFTSERYRETREERLAQLNAQGYLGTPEELLHIVSADMAREELLSYEEDEAGDIQLIRTLNPFTGERILVTRNFDVTVEDDASEASAGSEAPGRPELRAAPLEHILMEDNGRNSQQLIPVALSYLDLFIELAKGGVRFMDETGEFSPDLEVRKNYLVYKPGASREIPILGRNVLVKTAVTPSGTAALLPGMKIVTLQAVPDDQAADYRSHPDFSDYVYDDEYPVILEARLNDAGSSFENINALYIGGIIPDGRFIKFEILEKPEGSDAAVPFALRDLIFRSKTLPQIWTSETETAQWTQDQVRRVIYAADKEKITLRASLVSAPGTNAGESRAELRGQEDSFEKRLAEVLSRENSTFNPDLPEVIRNHEGVEYPYVMGGVWFPGMEIKKFDKFGAVKQKDLAYIRIGDWRFLHHRLKETVDALVSAEFTDLKKHILYLHDMRGAFTSPMNLRDYVLPMILAVDSLDLEGKRTLDFGAGEDGILSLVAARKGARPVMVDIKEQYIDFFLSNNLEINGFSPEDVVYVRGDINDSAALLQSLEAAGVRADEIDAIFANIGEFAIYPAGTHLNAVRYLDAFTQARFYVPGGYPLGLPSQGILKHDAHFQQVTALLEDFGFTEKARFQHEYTIGDASEGGIKTVIVAENESRSELRAEDSADDELQPWEKGTLYEIMAAKHERAREILTERMAASRTEDDFLEDFFEIMKWAFSQQHVTARTVSPERLADEIEASYNLFIDHITDGQSLVKTARYKPAGVELSEIMVVADDRPGLLGRVGRAVEEHGGEIRSSHYRIIRSPLSGKEVWVSIFEVSDRREQALQDSVIGKIEQQVREEIERKIIEENQEKRVPASTKMRDTVLQGEIAVLTEPVGDLSAVAYDIFSDVRSSDEKIDSKDLTLQLQLDLKRLYDAVERISKTLKSSPGLLPPDGIQLDETVIQRLEQYIDHVSGETFQIAAKPLARDNLHRQNALSIFLNFIHGHIEQARRTGQKIRVEYTQQGRTRLQEISVAEAEYVAAIVFQEFRGHFSVIAAGDSEEVQRDKIEAEKEAFMEALRESLGMDKAKTANQEVAARLEGLRFLIEEDLAVKIMAKIEGAASQDDPSSGVPLKAFRAIPLVVIPYIEKLREEWEINGDIKSRENAQDLDRIFKNVIRRMRKQGSIGEFLGGADVSKELVLFAHELDPYKVIELHEQFNIKAIVTDGASTASHWVIVAEDMGIPVFILDSRQVDAVNMSDPSWIGRKAILDGRGGPEGRPVLILNHTEETWRSYQPRLEEQAALDRVAGQRKYEKAVTPEGEEVDFFANVEKESEIAESSAVYGAEGVGLFRTEFVFTKTNRPLVDFIAALNANQADPSPEKESSLQKNRAALVDRFEKMFTDMARQSRVGDITIRMFDMQRDKEDPDFDALNPEKAYGPAYYQTALGKELLSIQLEAVLLANAKSSRGQIKVLFPMFRSPADLLQVLKTKGYEEDTLIDVVSGSSWQNELNRLAQKDFRFIAGRFGNAKDKLAADETLKWNEIQKERLIKTRFGVMIETVEGLEILDYMIPNVDFLSIGTNDLTVSLFRELAINRENNPEYFGRLERKVLEAIKDRILKIVSDRNLELKADAKNPREVSVTVCGALACLDSFVVAVTHDIPEHVRVQLSGSAVLIPSLKEIIRNTLASDTEGFMAAGDLNTKANEVLARVRERQLSASEFVQALEAVRAGTPAEESADPRAQTLISDEQKDTAEFKMTEYTLDADKESAKAESAAKINFQAEYMLGFLGMHALPASMIVKYFRANPALNATLTKEGSDEAVSMTDPFGLIGLGAFSVVTLELHGEEAEVLAARDFIEKNLVEAEYQNEFVFSSEYAKRDYRVSVNSLSTDIVAQIQEALKTYPPLPDFAAYMLVPGSTLPIELRDQKSLEELALEPGSAVRLVMAGKDAKAALEALEAIPMADGTPLFTPSADGSYGVPSDRPELRIDQNPRVLADERAAVPEERSELRLSGEDVDELFAAPMSTRDFQAALVKYHQARAYLATLDNGTEEAVLMVAERMARVFSTGAVASYLEENETGARDWITRELLELSGALEKVEFESEALEAFLTAILGEDFRAFAQATGEKGAAVHVKLPKLPEDPEVLVPVLAMVAATQGSLHLNIEAIDQEQAQEYEALLLATARRHGLKIPERLAKDDPFLRIFPAAKDEALATLPGRRLREGEVHGVLSRDFEHIAWRRGIGRFRYHERALLQAELMSAYMISVLKSMALKRQVADSPEVYNPEDLDPEFRFIVTAITTYLAAQAKIAASA